MSKRPVVIGLEIHLQLKTKTKLFCNCSTDYIGATPNTNVCPICLAVPGTLPVVNDHAVELAIRMGLGLHCKICDNTRFHRKHYFYADLPSAYQVTQYTHAIAQGGYLDIEVDGQKKRVHLDHLHLEEDAGKLVHPTSDGRLAGAAYSLVDYNRGGCPLSEIVSMPDMSSAKEAVAYVTQIRQLARYLGVSDGEMESGSLRCDVNVSLSNPDGSFGTRIELKNINSLRSIERALDYEIARQNKVLDTGGTLVQETRMWDDAAGVTRSMRNKEGAKDYRYYAEMNLAPMSAKPDYVTKIEKTLPEMPWDKRERFASQYGFSKDDVALLTEDRQLADYFETVARESGSPLRACNWIKTEVLRILKEQDKTIADFSVCPVCLGKLIAKVEKKDLSNTQAKDVFAKMIEKNLSLDEAIKKIGTIGHLTGEKLFDIISGVLRDNADAVEFIKSGKDKKGAKLKFLQGLVMRETRGNADIAEVSQTVYKLLGL